MDLSILLQYAFSGLTNGAIYALLALGIGLAFSATDIVDIAFGAYVVLGALLASTLVEMTDSMLLATFVTIACVGIVVLTAERITMFSASRRTESIMLVLITLAFYLVVEAFMLAGYSTDPRYLRPLYGETPIDIAGAMVMPQTLWVLGISFLIMFVLHYFLNKTKWGIAVAASFLDREAASMVGINFRRVSVLCFGISAVIGAVAGVLIIPITGMQYNMGFGFTLKGFAAGILGGLGKLKGALVGGLVLGLMEGFSAGLFPAGYKNIISFLVIILILIVKPEGIMGSKQVVKL